MITPMKTALISVSDKDGIVELAKFLRSKDIKIISTGGTSKVLMENGITHTPIEQVTGNPEAFGGRMKTISFEIASALLYRRNNKSDQDQVRDLGIPTIDLVVCNLYPFEEKASTQACETDLVEEIDIGGPLMIRAAAKNYESVTVLTDPSLYIEFIQYYTQNNGTSLLTRKIYAARAFDRIAKYDLAIAEEFGERFLSDRTDKFIALRKIKDLRYGENPHQKATWYDWKNSKAEGLCKMKVIQGKELSYNNLLDADAAWRTLSEVHEKMNSGFSACVVKHSNPCGLSHGTDPLLVLEEAWKGDEVSSFGGIIAVSFEIDLREARFFDKRFIEIILAPKFSVEAKEYLGRKKNLRLLELPLKKSKVFEKTIRSIHGGILFQDEDENIRPVNEYQSVTNKKFSDEQLSMVEFGVLACKHLKSNAIALVGRIDGVLTLVGAGMGQPNRLDSLHLLSTYRARKRDIHFQDLVLVSDAFFPFSDSIDAAHEHRIKYIVQPGGSIRDEEVIQKANELSIAMLFSGERHFRH